MFLDSYRKTDEQQKRAAKIETAQNSFWAYCQLIAPEFFQPQRIYQKELCNTLQDFYENKLLNQITQKPCSILLINIPPGFGKTYTVLLFTTWAYGKNIKNQVINVSYNQTLSIQSSKTVRELINDIEVHGDNNSYVVTSFFPNVKIKFGDGAMERWSLEGYYNSFLATSFDGSITSMRGSIGIIDDPIKNAVEALNENTKAAHFNFYKNTFKSRMLDHAKQIIVQTRWATDDLAGMMLKEYPDKSYELMMPAITDGKSLCEELYSLEDLQDKQRTIDEHIWLANYMQQPIDLTGALYGEFKTYDVLDKDSFERITAYVDTADLGTDYLCCIIAGIKDRYAYILDVYYTDEAMEITEKETARRLSEYNVREAFIESNNGGRGFARNVMAHLKVLKNKRCNVNWFHQSKNKRTRILVNAPNVIEQIIMPENFEKKYPKFYEHVSRYQRKGKNTFDDAPDTLTGITEIVNGELKGKTKVSILKRSWFGI